MISSLPSEVVQAMSNTTLFSRGVIRHHISEHCLTVTLLKTVQQPLSFFVFLLELFHIIGINIYTDKVPETYPYTQKVYGYFRKSPSRVRERHFYAWKFIEFYKNRNKFLGSIIYSKCSAIAQTRQKCRRPIYRLQSLYRYHFKDCHPSCLQTLHNDFFRRLLI